MAKQKAELTTGRQLLDEVLGRFRIQGTTLTRWSRENGIPYQNARAYLLGQRDGQKAREWRQRIVEASRQTRRARAGTRA